MDIDEIRARVQAEKSRRVEGRPYPAGLRAEVATFAREQRAMGRTWSQLCVEVGLSSTTMRNWMNDQPTDGFTQIQLLPNPPNSTPTLVLTSPNGFVLTGAGIDELAHLLRSLG